MRGLLLLCLCLCLTSPAGARSVHKCADGRGGHVYQSQACPQGASLRTWDAVPDPAPTSTPTAVSTRQPARPRPGPTSGQRVRDASRTAPARRDDQNARCLAARASRDSALQKLGHRRRYDDLRRLNERVSAVCNHRGRP